MLLSLLLTHRPPLCSDFLQSALEEMAQPQLLQIKLSRFDAQPWGFRLQGGVDFAQPLLVQKVSATNSQQTLFAKRQADDGPCRGSRY